MLVPSVEQAGDDDDDKNNKLEITTGAALYAALPYFRQLKGKDRGRRAVTRTVLLGNLFF